MTLELPHEEAILCAVTLNKFNRSDGAPAERVFVLIEKCILVGSPGGS
jgi:hypothetical protein